MYDRDALLAAVDLRALADELLGAHAGPDRSPTWPCPNPHHAQTGRTPPVNVFTSRRGEQRWRCHGCGQGGTAIDLVMAAHQVDLKGALDHLATRAGHAPQPPDWAPPQRPPARFQPPIGSRDARGLRDYVEDCARALWTPEGAPVRRWLTQGRGLPTDVLHTNQIGADLGPGHQPRPDGMPRTGGAVLPVIADGHAVYAQIRVLHPRPDRPRYLNPTAELVANPRLARIRPAERRHREVIVTEGAIDALSAAAGGYRAVAVLSAGFPDQAIAHALSRLPHRLVIAFDPDDAGHAGAQRLAGLLQAQHRPVAVLDLGHGDLNDTLLQARDWPRHLERQVADSVGHRSSRAAPALSR